MVPWCLLANLPRVALCINDADVIGASQILELWMPVSLDPSLLTFPSTAWISLCKQDQTSTQ
jgi:hypothetical protein